MESFGEQPGTHYDEPWWRAVRALYDEAFPGLPAGIDRAAALGARWTEVSTPFALFEGDRCVCHVGVITHPMWLRDRVVPVAGIHAACTVTDQRRRGLCRRTLGRALAWADQTHEVAKLHTDAPDVYGGHGFEPTPTWRFPATRTPAAEVPKRRLRPSTEAADAATLAALLADRKPVSRHLATADPGWMVTIVAALSDRLDSALWHLPDHGAIVAVDDRPGETLIMEVIARELPPAEVVLAAAPDPTKPACWTFRPDRLDPEATPEPAPARIGTFMVRGAWPDALAPFGISPLWEH
ncbi:MAG: GNAT family N-acetyltransferase [Deltaproteobacteria bacterium]|jgi:hypothetical protein|nr:GNAT family N-acetyltransferase [Deltaproteobacteria bacterium]MBW2532803.1 GNAT family N-acetyltransferase [Deltaproteobacteria bacterium]